MELGGLLLKFLQGHHALLRGLQGGAEFGAERGVQSRGGEVSGNRDGGGTGGSRNDCRTSAGRARGARAAVVRAGERDCEGGLGVGGDWGRGGFPAGEVHGVAEGGEAGEGCGEVEGAVARAARGVEGDGLHVAAGQNGLHEVAEDAAGAEFEEGRHAVGVHGLDLGGEVDRADYLAREEVAGLGGIGRVGRGGRVGVNRELASSELDVFQSGGEGLAGVGDERAVEGGGDLQHAAADGASVQFSGDLRNVFARAGEHELAGRVAVGDDELGTGGDEDFGDGGFGRDDGEHAAPVGGIGAGGHEAATDVAELVEGGGVEAAGGVERGQLAVAVTGGGGGCDTEMADDSKRAETHGSERGLG